MEKKSPIRPTKNTKLLRTVLMKNMPAWILKEKKYKQKGGFWTLEILQMDEKMTQPLTGYIFWERIIQRGETRSPENRTKSYKEAVGLSPS